jgi:replicative DNA helicase
LIDLDTEPRSIKANTPEVFEMSIIGAMISDTDLAKDIAYKADPSLFGSMRNQYAYTVLREAAMRDCPLGLSAAVAAIDNTPGGFEYYDLSTEAIRLHLMECVRIAEPAASWEEYLRGLELSHSRRSMLSALDTAQVGIMEAGDAAEAVSAALEAVSEVARECSYSSSADLEPVDHFMAAYEDTGGALRIPFTQEPLNTVGGMRAPNVVVVSAYTGGLKSWTCCDWALNAASLGQRVRFYPLEMSKIEMLERLAAMHCGLDYTDMVCHRLPSSIVRDAITQVCDLPIDFAMGKNNGQKIIADILSCDEKPNVVIVDHLQLLTGNGDNRQRIDSALEQFKATAIEHDICFILVSQLSRPENKSVPPEPNMFMLKESGGIEQIADYIIFVHEFIEKEMGYEKSTRRMWTAKQRNGTPAGKFDVRFTNNYRLRPI